MKFKTLLKKFVQNAEIDIVEVQHETYWADLECDKQDTINDHLLGHELALMTLELRYLQLIQCLFCLDSVRTVFGKELRF